MSEYTNDLIDRLRRLGNSMPPVNNGTPEGGHAYEAEVVLRAADELARLACENEELRAKSKPRPMSEWHEDIGPVLWFPDVKTWEDVECIESAYFGTPLDSFAPAEEMEWWVPFPDFSNVVKDPTPGGPHA
jgi:hypothetical protein